MVIEQCYTKMPERLTWFALSNKTGAIVIVAEHSSVFSRPTNQEASRIHKSRSVSENHGTDQRFDCQLYIPLKLSVVSEYRLANCIRYLLCLLFNQLLGALCSLALRCMLEVDVWVHCIEVEVEVTPTATAVPSCCRETEVSLS